MHGGSNSALTNSYTASETWVLPTVCLRLREGGEPVAFIHLLPMVSAKEASPLGKQQRPVVTVEH